MALAALIPIATQFVIPLVERLFSRRKEKGEPVASKDKQDAAVAFLQQIAALTGEPFSADEHRALIDQVVAVMNAAGLLPKPQPQQLAAGMPITFTGTLQIGAPK